MDSLKADWMIIGIFQYFDIQKVGCRKMVSEVNKHLDLIISPFPAFPAPPVHSPGLLIFTPAACILLDSFSIDQVGLA